MNFVTPNTTERTAYFQLVLLSFYAILGSVLFSILALLLIWPIYGLDSVQQIIKAEVLDVNINAFKMLQLLSTSVGMMLLPALALAWIERIKIKEFYPFKRPDYSLIILTIAIMLLANPFLEGMAILNQKMILPDFLKGVEAWMREKENATAEITKKMISMPSTWDFVINLIVIALFPAIGEELMFRGAIQRSFYKMFANPHVAIWLAAFIFSAIHMQFYGFLPRLLLGAGFGYLCFYSGSLWYAILGHFINNASVVCITYYMQLNNIPLANMDEPIGFAWYFSIISAILTLVLLKIFKNRAAIND